MFGLFLEVSFSVLKWLLKIVPNNICWLVIQMTYFKQMPVRLWWGMSMEADDLSCDMTNQQNKCAPSDDRSAWASTQSDQSSLCTQWVAKDPSFLHADSKDSDQTGQMPRLIWIFAGRTLTLLVLSCRGSPIDELSNATHCISLS